jgi:putative nucleotidyltransferase with HDIG domain
MLPKRAMIEQMQLRRDTAVRIEKAFVDTANTIREIEKNLHSRPAETLQVTTRLVQQIAASLLSAPELLIQVMGDKLGGDELYFHSLNVTMLSMKMARDLKLPIEVVAALGVGALLHDIGRKEDAMMLDMDIGTELRIAKAIRPVRSAGSAARTQSRQRWQAVVPSGTGGRLPSC